MNQLEYEMLKRYNELRPKKDDVRQPITFLDALGLLFIGLKIAHEINWSWWLVLMPIYIPILFAIINGIIKREKEKKKYFADEF